MKQLQYLNLSSTLLHGVVPHNLGNLSSLRVLDLSYTEDLVVDDLTWISRLSSLEHLDFSWVDLSPTKDLLKNIEELDLAGNKFYGHLPEEIGGLKKLMYLDLTYNVFINGTIPNSLGKLSALRVLGLSNNNLFGSIPSSLGDLRELEELYLGQLSNLGTFYEDHFANLSKLSTLVFPQWVQMQKELEYLSIKNCSISDTLSNSLNNSKNMTDLYLSNNHIQGPIPNNISQMLPFLQALYLDQNHINESIPDSLCEIKSLQVMDLSRNHLSGNLPECLGNLHDLMAMRLSSNEISGVIPNSISGAYSLEYLNLNNNSLTGKLPRTMKNCTKLIVVDIGENIFLGKLPQWVGNYLPDLRLLRLRNNKFYGQIPFEVCQLLKLQMLDLANNNLTGGIPNCFGNLSGMVLNSNYHYYWAEESFTEVLKGLELEYSDKISRFLVNLDVSNNNLVGKFLGS
ncbi:hypothetical protein RD792_006385 [Penstemon davidsonii]|uniref:Uncharacterized protein n=1 Tax=Penstemon davidsonii TaxID=160366 RepID=A0ABR0DCX3_9LAMI|nr:hypothetical protein RD792_006385 [Penstemon davidsonii]